jgi:molybdopterin-binding protein
MTTEDDHDVDVRIGQAAEMLGVSVETIRRWATSGRTRTTRSDGGQRLIPLSEVTRLLRERRAGSRGVQTTSGPTPAGRPIAAASPRAARRPRAAGRGSIATSARNRFPGIVTRVERDGVAAVVEVQSGPHRLVSLMTAEAVEELGLEVGTEAICIVKATNVIVDVPAR